MNLGTIGDTEKLGVRLSNRHGGKPLGEIEESFTVSLTPGDIFLIGGEVVKYEGLREMSVIVSREATKKQKIMVFTGTKFAASRILSHRIIDKLQADEWPDLPRRHTSDWLYLQRSISRIPDPDRLLVESFEGDGRQFTCFYGFAERNALQTLELLVTRRM